MPPQEILHRHKIFNNNKNKKLKSNMLAYIVSESRKGGWCFVQGEQVRGKVCLNYLLLHLFLGTNSKYYSVQTGHPLKKLKEGFSNSLEKELAWIIWRFGNFDRRKETRSLIAMCLWSRICAFLSETNPVRPNMWHRDIKQQNPKQSHLRVIVSHHDHK